MGTLLCHCLVHSGPQASSNLWDFCSTIPVQRHSVSPPGSELTETLTLSSSRSSSMTAFSCLFFPVWKRRTRRPKRVNRLPHCIPSLLLSSTPCPSTHLCSLPAPLCTMAWSPCPCSSLEQLQHNMLHSLSRGKGEGATRYK